MTVNSPYRLLDIRQRFVDSEGILKWATPKEAFNAVKAAVPETVDLIPCSLKEDHSNQSRFPGCPKCNPTGFMEA